MLIVRDPALSVVWILGSAKLFCTADGILNMKNGCPSSSVSASVSVYVCVFAWLVYLQLGHPPYPFVGGSGIRSALCETNPFLVYSRRVLVLRMSA